MKLWHSACHERRRNEAMHTSARHSQTTLTMLRYTIIFLVVALIAAALGFGGISGIAASIAKILFIIFLVLFIISLFMGRRGPSV